MEPSQNLGAADGRRPRLLTICRFELLGEYTCVCARQNSRQDAFNAFLKKAAQFASERRQREAAEEQKRRERYGGQGRNSSSRHGADADSSSGAVVPRFDPAKNYYSVLGIAQTACLADIKSRYKRLALQHHPDKQVGKTEEEVSRSEAVFREVQEAFDILSDAGLVWACMATIHDLLPASV